MLHEPGEDQKIATQLMLNGADVFMQTTNVSVARKTTKQIMSANFEENPYIQGDPTGL